MLSSLSTSDANFLRGIDKIKARMERAQLEVASGKRIFSASDEPDGISPLLSTRAELEANEQIKNNLGRTKAEVDAAEGNLQQSIKVLERARVLATQAQNSFNQDSTWNALALESADLTQQMLNVSNIAVEGRYIFAGNSDLSQPFDYDAGLASVTAYAGGPATRQSLFPGGNPFDIARAGQDIFDNAGIDAAGISKSVFAALRDLKNSLEAKDMVALKSAMLAVETSTKHIAGELSFYGAAQRRVYEATAASESTGLRLQTQLKRLEDSDTTSAILEMQQAQFQQEAAFRIRAQLPRKSLFDYMG